MTSQHRVAAALPAQTIERLIRLRSQGCTPKQVAERLGISPRTARAYFQKMAQGVA